LWQCLGAVHVGLEEEAPDFTVYTLWLVSFLQEGLVWEVEGCESGEIPGPMEMKG